MKCIKDEEGKVLVQEKDIKDGWKEYFKNSSIRTRDTEVIRYQCNGYSKDPVDAINREWDRIERDLGIKLPDYVPESIAPTAETPATESYRGEARIATENQAQTAASETTA